MRREFWNKTINVLSGVLIATGLLLLFGAAGESDMYEEMGKRLPLVVTVKKMAIGLLMSAFGVMILNRRKEDE